MLKLLITLLVLFVGSNALAIESDKLLHASTALGATSLCSALFSNALKLQSPNKWSTRIACAVLVSAVGLAKEVADMPTGGVLDQGDLLANTLGVAAGVGLAWSFDF